MHAHIKTNAQEFLQEVYDAHGSRLNSQHHEEFKAGRCTKDHYLVKTKVDLQDLLAAREKQKSAHRRAARTEANKAFADQHKGLRRAFAAARPPPQPPMICIRHKDKPCFDPDSIDVAYDDQIGSMFEGEGGGYGRRLARAGAFIDKYADVIHAGDQFPIKPLNAVAIHSILTSTGSVAASFDHIYPQEPKLLPHAHSEWPTNIYELVERRHRWPTCMLPTRAIFLLKADGDPNMLTDYRVLMITSTHQTLHADRKSVV